MTRYTLLRAYTAIGKRTPIPADCGELCNAKCCKGGKDDGMLLLPGEQVFLRHSPGIELRKTPEGLRYAVCHGRCNRLLRPFMCRIYPLVMVPDGNSCRVIPDPRAKYHCPLLRAQEYLDPDFIAAVKRAGDILMGDPDGRAFLCKLGKEVEEYSRFTGL